MSRSTPVLDLKMMTSDNTETRVRQYTERLHRAFLDSEATPKSSVESVSPTAVSSLKQIYSRLQFANSQKEREISEMKSVLASIRIANVLTSPDFEMATYAKSPVLSPLSPDDPITRLKSDAAAAELKTTKELQATDELLYAIRKAKESTVRDIQRVIRNRLEQLRQAREKLLKDGPAIKLLKAESVNDLTHSVYTLRKKREDYKEQTEKLTSIIHGQKTVVAKAAGENGELVDSLARREVTKQETVSRQRLALQGFESLIRQRASFLSASERHREQLATFKLDMRRLQQYPLFRVMSRSDPADSVSIDQIIESYNGLVVQHDSLASRYETLTESENTLVNKLKSLHLELNILKLSANEPTFSPKYLPSGDETPSLNYFQGKIEEMKGSDRGEDEIKRTETSTIYLFLFFLEAKRRLSTILGYLQAHLPNEQLQTLLMEPPPMSEDVLYSAVGGIVQLKDPKMTAQVTHLYNEVLPLRLASSLQQLQSVVGEADNEEELLVLFEKALGEAQEGIRVKFKAMLGEMKGLFETLTEDTRKIASYVSATTLSQAQTKSFDDFRLELIRTHEQILIREMDSKKLSQLVVGILEFKMRQITRQRKLSDFKLRADFQNYVNKAICDLKEEPRAETRTNTNSEMSSPRKLDRDFQQLMLRGPQYESPKPRDKPTHWSYSPSNIERDLKVQMALTEAKLKKVREISEG